MLYMKSLILGQVSQSAFNFFIFYLRFLIPLLKTRVVKIIESKKLHRVQAKTDKK